MLIVANPGGGRGRTKKLLPRAETLLKNSGIHYEVRWTEAPKHATTIALEERDNYDTIVAFGGDGTVHELINGLVDSNTRLGIIPIGTGNDFARSCGVSLTLEKAVETLIEGKTNKVDLGIVNDLYFGNVVGVGFDAYVNRESLKIEKLKGTMVFIVAVFKTLGKYTSIPLKIELDDETIEESTYLVSIGNGWSVGAGLQLTPDALLDNGIFHICHIRDVSSLKVVMNFPKLMNGKINEVDEVTMYKSRHVKITSEEPLPIHIDGEIPENDITELDIQILPKRLSVIGSWESRDQEKETE